MISPTEKDIGRAVKREQALRKIREAGEAEGVSRRLIDESETSMRAAFAMGDALDAIFGSMFSKTVR